jgi:hypothetical protein
MTKLFSRRTEQNQLGLQEDMAGQEIAIVTCL